VKNRVSVALSTANPPHTHCTKIVPIYGTADSKLVITVAPQKDICPHGNTYPRKAVAIVANRISTPIDQVWISL
jgi:predicted P-loop ATPase/GTPase